MLTNEDVIWAYRFYLDRDPENNIVIEDHLSRSVNREMLIERIMNSSEYQQKKKTKQDLAKNPFWHYHTTFGAVEIILKYAKKQITASPLHVTNFLGVKIRPEFFPGLLDGCAGEVNPIPIPQTWHADMAEWASCLRAVDLSGDTFSMLEIGCGWGCWMNNLGMAAKSSGKTIKLYGIEANLGHLDFARKAFADNEISEEEYVLSHGIAGNIQGEAWFPKIHSGVDWGGEAVFNPQPQQLDGLRESYQKVPIVDIRELIKNEKWLDFLHVDIQGAELSVLVDIYELICEKVRYVFIGTHSKQIEGGLFELFLQGNDWSLEMERPAFFNLIDGHPVVSVDGVQAYRNNKLVDKR